MTPRSLVVGATGYVARALSAQLPGLDLEPVSASRRDSAATLRICDGEELDAVLSARDFDQVVVLPQLSSPDLDWLLKRIDGPRWLVFSSAQLQSSASAPGAALARAREKVALQRGATVLRPTMLYGRGGDKNISRLIRVMRRAHVALQVGDGSQLVQPLHVDDVAALVSAHARAPRQGLFRVGGPEALPAAELLEMLKELLGIRGPTVRVPAQWLGRLAVLGRVWGLRVDQVRRLDEDKTVDNDPVARAFGWTPEHLAHRLEQAVGELAA